MSSFYAPADSYPRAFCNAIKAGRYITSTLYGLAFTRLYIYTYLPDNNTHTGIISHYRLFFCYFPPHYYSHFMPRTHKWLFTCRRDISGPLPSTRDGRCFLASPPIGFASTRRYAIFDIWKKVIARDAGLLGPNSSTYRESLNTNGFWWCLLVEDIREI